QLHHLLLVPVDQRRDQRLLAGEVLIQRADADACDMRNPVGAGAVVAFLDQNASGRFEQRTDSGARSLLRGRFSKVSSQSRGHIPPVQMRVYTYERSLIF